MIAWVCTGRESGRASVSWLDLQMYYCLLREVEEGAVTVMQVEGFPRCDSLARAPVRKKDSERWKGEPWPWRSPLSSPLMLSALISGKHDSDLGLGSWVHWCSWFELLVLFFVKRLMSLSLSSLGLCADRVRSSLTAFNSDWKSSRGHTILGFFPILLSLSAAMDSMVRRIRGYMSSTMLKCSTERENKLQYVSERTEATRRALVSKQISVGRTRAVRGSLPKI